MKLVRLEPLPDSHPKKFRAVFRDGDRQFSIVFGARGYEDYTIHKDKDRRTRYRNRHAKDLRTQDPTRAGFLSYYLLWGESTSLAKNLKEYRKMFSL